MSASSRKGYRGEAAVLRMLADELGGDYYRPRAGKRQDCGDIAGLPTVHSVKNCKRLDLSAWVDDLADMCANARQDAGVIWAHRKGCGDPRDWYVITTGRLYLPVYRAALAHYQLGEGDETYAEPPSQSTDQDR